MAHALQGQLEQVGTYERLAFTERLALLVEQEAMSREQRKQERLIRHAHFRLAANVAGIGDNTSPTPFSNRLMHNAHRLPLKGDLMRKILGQLTEGEHLG